MLDVQVVDIPNGFGYLPGHTTKFLTVFRNHYGDRTSQHESCENFIRQGQRLFLFAWASANSEITK